VVVRLTTGRTGGAALFAKDMGLEDRRVFNIQCSPINGYHLVTKDLLEFGVKKMIPTIEHRFIIRRFLSLNEISKNKRIILDVRLYIRWVF
jgi:hypothetical protein